MKEKIGIGFIGLGQRGPWVLDNFINMEDVEVVALCDRFPERLEEGAKRVTDANQPKPILTTDYKDMLKMDNIDAIINSGAWADHTQIAIDTMEAGKAIAFEVGGAYSIEECWDLVKVQERTKMHCMMLENCCYGKLETTLLNMVKQGIFGKVVHCDGGYCHDLRKNMVICHEKYYHYRLKNYMHRNSDCYPTHALGPIMKILNINRGNKFVSLTSMASCSAGLNEHIKADYGEDHELANFRFAQGDVVTTTIKCANGETITLRLDTTLPRPYSRRFEVHGTKGMYMEDGNVMFLENEHYEMREKVQELYNNADEYIEKYKHPLWVESDGDAHNSDMTAGHGGMDPKVMRAFIDSVKYDLPTPIDVYDSAALMCITALSEESIAKGGAPVGVPDFTKGKYLTREPLRYDDNKWNL